METPTSSGRRAVFFSVFTALFLGIGKTVIGFLSGSLAIFASAADSFLDAGISATNAWVLKKAEEPADQEHSFGHGKFEAFAEFIQGIFLFAVAIILLGNAVMRLDNPIPINHEIIGIITMSISLGATLILAKFLDHTAHETGSLVVKADSAHYSSDVLANGAVIVGIFFSWAMGWWWTDGVMTIFVALLIGRSAKELLVESFEVLTDREICRKKKDILLQIFRNDKIITDFHDVRTRRVGSHIHIDAHLVFTPETTLLQAHDHSDFLEKKIHKSLPKAVILFHFDPFDDRLRPEK